MATTSSDGKVCSSPGSDIPLWFVSCQSLRLEKIASRLSITPSPLPPFSGLSNSASARNPLGSDDGTCGLKLPNNSVPLSIVPLLLRSSTSQAFVEPGAVQEVWTG